MEYLFSKWDQLKEKLRDRSLFIFLDFDGTLVPIVETPVKAKLPAKTKTLLRKIASSTKVKLAFISGRNIEDIKNKIGIKNAIYSGNHGLEIEGPEIRFKPVVPREFRKALEKISERLQKQLSSFKGILIEDKGLSLSIHYRLAKKGQIPKIKTILHEAVILPLVRNKIKIKSGKMVLEIRPPVEWDKGKVVLWLLARKIFVSQDITAFPIYIGDDITDEDAFSALKDKGLNIFVGEPRESYAQYYLKSPNEVTDFLERVSRITSS